MSPPAAATIDPSAAGRRRCVGCGLRAQCVGATLAGHDLDRFDRMVAHRAPVAPGQTVFHSGERMRAVYMVRAGALKSIAEHPDGRQQVLGFHQPGELVGVDGLGSGRHTCRLEALQRSRLCPLPWDALQALAAELPTLRRQLMSALGRAALSAQRHVGILGAPPPRRLGLLLDELAERRAGLSLPRDELQLPMSREDIASYLGMAEETVCRQFTRLHAGGVLRVKRRTVRILDRLRLLERPAQRQPPHDGSARRSRSDLAGPP